MKKGLRPIPDELYANAYQRAAVETAIYSTEAAIIYPTLGLAGEAGEVANKVSKIIRDRNGFFDGPSNQQIIDEVGDVLWYCAALLRDLDCTMEEAMQRNLIKLNDRKARGVLGGSGDKR